LHTHTAYMHLPGTINLTKAMDAIRGHEVSFWARTLVSSCKVVTSVGAKPIITLIIVLNMIVELKALQVRCIIRTTRVEMKIGVTSRRAHST
jgi:hypothetical protein